MSFHHAWHRYDENGDRRERQAPAAAKTVLDQLTWWAETLREAGRKRVMAPDLVPDITPGFPNSGVYHGWDNVATDFFGKMTDYESFGAVPEKFYADDDNHVFVYGHYHAETKTGNKADVRFLRLWTVRDGKFVRMQQIADSHLLQEALNG